MLGAGMQFNRSRGEGRFYNPKSRRNQQNQQRKTYQLQRAQSDVTSGQCKETFPVSRYQEPENRDVVASEPVTSPDLEPITFPSSNVEKFVESIMPSVPARFFSKTATINWRISDVEQKPYFLLSDLWESFQEWSFYGAGVPLELNSLNDNQSVVQYYAPYLSAIQLYVDPLKSRSKPRRGSEDSDGDFSSRDSSSDWSSDSERERFSAYSRGQQNHCEATDISCKMERFSLVDQQISLQEGFSSDDGESGDSKGHLLFQYLELDPPYSREPLSEKIADLALRFPDLNNLRSCDLAPSSWLSVAWYPIYRIPNAATMRELDACFLTYHSLCTQNQDVAGAQPPVLTNSEEMNGISKFSLPVFGLSSYKYKGSLWTSSKGTSRQLVNSLSQNAANWLGRLQVNHPDYEFFSRR